MRVGLGRYLVNGLYKLLGKAFTECYMDIAGANDHTLSNKLKSPSMF